MKKNNNKGITLVEVIVSIAILAIIVLPLLNAFVVATKTNVKAKNKLRATQVASNVMESLENVDISDIAYQFNYSSEGFSLFNLSSESSTYELEAKSENGSTSYYDVASTEGCSSSIAKAEDGSYSFIEDDDHSYYFFATNLVEDNKKFNALITIKASDAGDQEGSYNSASIASLESMNTNTDAISANTDTASQVINAIYYANGVELSQSDISRTITIDVSKSATATKVVASYSYKYYDSSKGRYVTFPESGSAYEQDYTSTIYDNSSHTDDQLANIYLLYYPWYTSTGRYQLCTDNIIINNPDLVKCQTHIIKQNIESADALYLKEHNYKTMVYLNENGNNSLANMSIETNLGINMSNEAEESRQVTYVYNSKITGNASKMGDYITITQLGDQNVSDRLFNVKVDVYSGDVSFSDIADNTALVSLTGGLTSE